MYAVFQTGGKQYRVSEGQIVRVEKLKITIGETVEFDQVMMIGHGSVMRIGNPFVNSVKIAAEVVTHGRSDKVMIVKFRRRKHCRKHQGHRQWFTDIRITGIGV